MSRFLQLPVATTSHLSGTNHLEMGDIPMASRIPRLSFEHQEPLGRPSCPRCGQLCWFPERMEFGSGRVWNSWECESCSTKFQTSVLITSDIDVPCVRSGPPTAFC